MTHWPAAATIFRGVCFLTLNMSSCCAIICRSLSVSCGLQCLPESCAWYRSSRLQYIDHENWVPHRQYVKLCVFLFRKLTSEIRSTTTNFFLFCVTTKFVSIILYKKVRSTLARNLDHLYKFWLRYDCFSTRNGYEMYCIEFSDLLVYSQYCGSGLRGGEGRAGQGIRIRIRIRIQN